MYLFLETEGRNLGPGATVGVCTQAAGGRNSPESRLREQSTKSKGLLLSNCLGLGFCYVIILFLF